MTRSPVELSWTAKKLRGKTQQKNENKDKRTTSKVLVWQTELGTGSDGKSTSGTYEYQCKEMTLDFGAGKTSCNY